MFKTKFLTLAFATSAIFALAQQPATSAETFKKALEQKQEFTQTSLVKNVPFQSIGPTIMSGRVVDVAVNPERVLVQFFIGKHSKKLIDGLG